MRRAGLGAALAALLLATGAASSRAQSPDTTGIRDVARILHELPPLPPGFGDQTPPEPPPARRPAPLEAAQLVTLRQAQSLRMGGRLDEAAKSLAPLQAMAPHHPLVLHEQAALLLARGQFGAVEKLARQERAQQKDSLLLGPALVQALQRLAHPREAADVAIAMWVQSPLAGRWSEWTLERLLAAEPKGIRDDLRRAAERDPSRTDLAYGVATLTWRAGEHDAAIAWLAPRDGPGGMQPLRDAFAEDRLRMAAPDSVSAAAALVSLAGDARYDAEPRLAAARRALQLGGARTPALAEALRQALHDVPQARWGGALSLELARALREGGRTGEARQVIAGAGGNDPALAMEQAMDELREGPTPQVIAHLAALRPVWGEAGFRLGEALFFAGDVDSALAVYKAIADDPSGPFTGASLERIYLIEDADPKSALPAYGHMAWLEWRGDTKAAQAAAESLYATLPRGTLWAQAALACSRDRERAGDVAGALIPALAVADSLPDDRLAPVARQRAGDLYLDKLKDERNALAQYEECLARYPRAWNAAEVRRRVEQLRRERRF